MKMTHKLALLSAVSLLAFNNKTGWKLDADGKIEMKDGNPVWIDADGTEKTLGADTVTRLNGEAKANRIAKEAAETKLAAYTVDGKPIDPTEAAKAIGIVKNIDAKKLIDAGEVDKVRDTVKAEFTGQLTEAQKANSDLQARLDNMTVGGVFSSSEFVRDRVAVPRDMFEATFRSNFKVEDGKPVAYDRAGNRVMSKKRLGEWAEPDEALELLVEQHPQKDAIIKANSNSGSNNNGGGGNKGGGRYLKRSEFDQLDPGKKAAIAADMQAGTVTLVD